MDFPETDAYSAACFMVSDVSSSALKEQAHIEVTAS